MFNNFSDGAAPALSIYCPKSSVAELEPVEPKLFWDLELEPEPEPKLRSKSEPEPKRNNFGSATLPKSNLNTPYKTLSAADGADATIYTC